MSSSRLSVLLTAVSIIAMAETAPPLQPQAQVWLNATPSVPAFEIPATEEAWKTARQIIRTTLTQLLGDLPARPKKLSPAILERIDQKDYWQETFSFDNGAGALVKGYCFVPKTASPTNKAPAILYCHWHGGEYDVGKKEMLQTNATPVPPGPELAKRGYVVLGIDAYGFGERNGQGPDGPENKGSAGEMTASKYELWFGRSLWGMIVRDDQIALDYLCNRPEVDASRIGVTGISMGSTRAWWLMALDDRPKAAVCVACMTRYQDLIQHGMLKAHGIYYFVPGLLKHFDTEAVIACGAPQPMLFMTGDQDSGSPVEGVCKLGDLVSRVYDLYGEESKAQFESILFPGVGHVYLPEMWQKTVAWMDRWVK